MTGQDANISNGQGSTKHPAGTRILGIDPGLQITGYGIIEVAARSPKVLEAGVLRSAEGRSTTDMAARLRTLYNSLDEVLKEFAPAIMAMEQLYAHYKHPRTAILMAHARGALMLAAALHDIPVISYNATRIKKTITGSGRASKEQIQRTIQSELRLKTIPDPPDVADALAAALCHYYEQRKP